MEEFFLYFGHNFLVVTLTQEITQNATYAPFIWQISMSARVCYTHFIFLADCQKNAQMVIIQLGRGV